MKPKHYTDYLVLDQPDPNDSSAPIARGLLLGILHGWFQRHPGQYAIAILPDCRGLRVFASTQDDMMALSHYLRPQYWIRDYVRMTPIMEVPANFQGPWITYTRYRIPTLSSDRHTDNRHGTLRAKRLNAVTRERMAHFYVRSASTQQGFSLCVQHLKGSPQEIDCTPNSYGLATTKNLFSVPDLPLTPLA